MQISSDEKQQILTILAMLPEKTQVYVFGSRANSTARPFSDLDLLIKAENKIDWQTKALLDEAFSESDLPYSVDVVYEQDLSQEFKQQIQSDLVRVYS